MSQLLDFVAENPNIKVAYFIALLVILVLVLHFVSQSTGNLSEALTDWATGKPFLIESRQGTGLTEMVLPYSSRSPFPVLTSITEDPYAAGYIERIPL